MGVTTKYLEKLWTMTSFSIVLLVFCRLTICLSQEASPRFGNSIQNVSAVVGQDVSLSCVVEGIGSYRTAWVHWLSVGRYRILSIHPYITTRDDRISVSFNPPKTFNLNIKSVKQEDEGYYMCQMTTVPAMVQSGYLQVSETLLDKGEAGENVTAPGNGSGSRHSLISVIVCLLLLLL